MHWVTAWIFKQVQVCFTALCKLFLLETSSCQVEKQTLVSQISVGYYHNLVDVLIDFLVFSILSCYNQFYVYYCVYVYI